MPPRPERFRYCPVLGGRQPRPELALDDLPVPGDRCRSADDENDITVTHDFATLEAAKAFTDSQELKAAMHEAGVTSAPTIWFATRT